MRGQEEIHGVGNVYGTLCSHHLSLVLKKNPLNRWDKCQTAGMVGLAMDAGGGDGLNYELKLTFGYQCSELLPIYQLLNVCIGQDLSFRLLGKELVFIWACLHRGKYINIQEELKKTPYQASLQT